MIRVILPLRPQTLEILLEQIAWLQARNHSFAGSVGRTDFPDGDWSLLEKGIREKLYTMPDDTVLLSGHGPATTVGREKASNPFVKP